MKNYNLYLIPTLILCISATGVKERNRASCTLIDSRIYCFGGGRNSAVEGSYAIYDEHFYLDLTTSFTANQPLTNWVIIPPPNNYKVEQRWGQGCSTFVGSEVGYVMAMGSSNTGSRQNTLANTTVAYSPTNQTWTTIPTDSALSLPNSFALSSVIDKNGIAWLYGGLIPLDNRTSILDGFYDAKANSTNVTLPSDLYGIDTNTWKWTTLSLPLQYQTRADHAAAITNDNKMYIIGGMTINTDPNINLSRIYAKMEQVLIFDTVHRNWTQITTNGPTPNQRRAFTLDYLPYKNQFVLYGGIFDTGNRATGRVPILDVCYTLDIANSTWTPIDVQSQQDNPTKLGSGQLYGHNSILYDKDLFIMFGVDENNDYRGDVNILDTMTWQWKSSHEAPSTAWTVPVIVGLVLGVLLAIILVGCIIYILRYRRPASLYNGNTFLPTKRAQGQFTIDTADPRLQMDDTEPVYQEFSTTPVGTAISSSGENDHRQPTSPAAAHALHSSRSLPATRSPSSESFKSAKEQQQHLQKDRPMSAALFGSISLTTGLSARPMSSMSHCVTESNITSFSGTTKPDQSDPLPLSPSSPTSPMVPTMQRVKPDGET
ncbi:unnamed protein product [Absidia cylindrospora]